MLDINLEDIYTWYKLSGEPTRDKIRSGELILPKGISKGLVESLLPYFTSLKDKPIVTSSNREDKKETSMVVTSDWHIPFHDVEAAKVFIDFLYEYQPDILVLNGNMNDCTSFSSHPKLRDVALAFTSAREERKEWFSVAELLRTVLPNSKIIYIGSQCHEGWIDKWASLSPITLEDYENYSIPGWFRLGDFNIDYVPEVYDPIGTGDLLISHGTIARGKSGASAMASLEMEGTSTIVGHTHKLAQVYKTTARDEVVGIECGCLCQRTPWYHLKGKRLMMDWQQGFVLVNIKDNSFSAQCIPIIRDSNDNPYFWIGKERYGSRD